MPKFWPGDRVFLLLPDRGSPRPLRGVVADVRYNPRGGLVSYEIDTGGSELIGGVREEYLTAIDGEVPEVPETVPETERSE